MQHSQLTLSSRYRFLAGLLLATAALLLAGCTRVGDGASVEGTVTVNGKPLDAGAINFVPIRPTTGPSAGAAIADGRYSIYGPKAPLPGKYRVEIVGTRKTGKQSPDMLSPGSTVEGIEQFIPDKYNVKSRLEVELRAGDNRGVDFDLTIP
jgi:hypothetical protein